MTAIGTKMHGVPGVMARIVTALLNDGCEILQSSDSHMHISCLINEKDEKKAVITSYSIHYTKLYEGGLIIDILTGYGLGLSAIPFAIGGFIAGILSEYINNEHYLSSVIFVVITLFVYDIFMFMSLYFSRSVIVINIDLVS